MIQSIAIAIILVASVVNGFAPAAVSFQKNGVVNMQQTPSSSLSSYLTSSPRRLASSSLAAVSSGERSSVDTKIYKPSSKETPKVLGGVKIGLRKLVVITGASSGLGLSCAESLAKNGKYFVVMAVRDVEKGKRGESVRQTGRQAVLLLLAHVVCYSVV